MFKIFLVLSILISFSYSSDDITSYKTYSLSEILKKISSFKIKDDFEKKSEYQKRIIKTFGKKCLIEFPKKDVKVKYDIETSKMFISFRFGNGKLKRGNIRYGKYNLSTVYLIANQNLIESIRPHNDSFDGYIKYYENVSLNHAKSISKKKNYAYSVYFLTTIGIKTIEKNKEKYGNKNFNIDSLVVTNKNLKYKHIF
jgi:hypothetical protein